MERPLFCAYCAKPTQDGAGLCETCLLGITKYPDQNAVIVTAYVRRGIAQIDHVLEGHAKFQRWLTENPSAAGE